MHWSLIIIAIGFVGLLLLLLKREPEPKGDKMGAADRASAELITMEVAEGFRSGLRKASNAELISMQREGARLQIMLKETEKVLASRPEPEMLANVRIGLRQICARLAWIDQECERRAVESVEVPGTSSGHFGPRPAM